MQLGPPLLLRKTAAPALGSPFFSTSSEIGGSTLPSLLLGRGSFCSPLARTSASGQAATAKAAVALSSGGMVFFSTSASSAWPPALDFPSALIAASRSASGALTSRTVPTDLATSSWRQLRTSAAKRDRTRCFTPYPFLGGGGAGSGITRFKRQAIASATFGSLFLPFFVQASRTSFSRLVQAIPKASRYHFGTYRSCRSSSCLTRSLFAIPS